MKNRIRILDCTLRDGGLCLEDANKNGIDTRLFSRDMIDSVIRLFSASQIDIIELGSIEISDNDKTGYAVYQSIEDISKYIPQKRSLDQMYAALYRGPDTRIEKIPDWNPSLCEVVRVIIRYSELQKSIDFCRALAKKGYKVFVQPMLTMRYTEEELQLLIDAANDMKAYALYFVDSYGYMLRQDVERLFTRFDKELNKAIRIGFHAHNNMNMAFANVLNFIEISGDRDIIIDSCVQGMGQGAGNLQTEIIVSYMNKTNRGKYNYNSVLEICDIIQKYNQNNLWGYSVERYISAQQKVAYKYAVALRNQYGMSFSEINKLLELLSEDMKHRYTEDNIRNLLEISKRNSEYGIME